MFLMSDIRTKLLLGTSISAVAMMFVMASGVDIFANDTSASETSFPIIGHVTVLAVNPDGSTSYIQTDNALLGGGKTLAAIQLFDGGTGGAALAEAFNCIALGNDGTVDVTTAVLTNPLTNTPAACDTNGLDVTQAGGNGGGNAEIIELIVPFTIGAGDAGAITEVVLGQVAVAQQVTGVLSHVDITDVPVAVGTIITITYELQVG